MEEPFGVEKSNNSDVLVQIHAKICQEKYAEKRSFETRSLKVLPSLYVFFTMSLWRSTDFMYPIIFVLRVFYTPSFFFVCVFTADLILYLYPNVF